MGKVMQKLEKPEPPKAAPAPLPRPLFLRTA